MTRPATLRAAPSDGAEDIGEMQPGDPFSMLDNSLGWVWGYAGSDRRVGYLRAESVGAV